jgi:hypothetical protein
MRNRGNYLGSDFEIWTAQRTWFWSVTDPGRNGGMIGVAATEAEAMREACLSIEKKAMLCGIDPAGISVDCENSSIDNSRMLAGWVGSLRNLERYLSCVGGAAA